ncbi:hypothetical protein, partial [Allofournierella sp.]|uniref:hypothetical protein n=1 Tax=Allofournierella sp. TaxID=1940256 RepID=UPI003AB1E7E5
MTFSGSVCLLVAGAALASLLGGCAVPPGAAASSAPSSGAASCASDGQGAWQPPGAAELDAIKKALKTEEPTPESGHYLSYSSRFVGVLSPEEQAKLPWLGEPLLPAGGACSGFISWRGYLAVHPACQVAQTELVYEYTPETAILGPQYPHGQYAVYSLLTQTAQGWQAVDSHRVYLAEPPGAPPEPLQQQLDLTRSQWVMLQHQVRSLVSGGIARSFSGVQEFSPQELGRYLCARASDWNAAGVLSGSPSDGLVGVILQADFSAENGSWVGADLLPEWARQEGAE